MQEEAIYDKVAQRLKALRAIEFVGTTELKEAEKWLRTLEKYFLVMQCLKVRKVDLAVFLLQEEAEDWWTLEENRRGRIN
ncbi:hypothetical protein E5676_scaffold225G00320 [Cucumis melo var. makuwa]|uniref:Uncharacterized protein n=1 Tax=Cucumis melo var. makuwa TaxID=1194695 RepID=A0A5A7UJ94_CUCMM|nr:hypothetical protein E6C27_scaffold319G001580 [Cucumis melo var. makuwa]TYK27700.1 hypothetical protein E5676_scaffold225G00320 [Cucumis melo var. makuwa]